ncbi:MAG: hypothetical protein ABIG63_12205, partial [Chloroflexota bacterium]
MEKRITWFVLSCLLVAGLILSACAPKTTPVTTPTTSPTTTPVTIPTTTAPPVATVSPPTTPTAVKEQPIYGGTINVLFNFAIGSWDPADGNVYTKFPHTFIYDKLMLGDWARGPGGTNEWPFE